MSFWVSVWTPLSLAFSWAALNLASAVVGDWTEALGICGGLLGGNVGEFTELVLVGAESFLTGSGPGFTELALVG